MKPTPLSLPWSLSVRIPLESLILGQSLVVILCISGIAKIMANRLAPFRLYNHLMINMSSTIHTITHSHQKVKTKKTKSKTKSIAMAVFTLVSPLSPSRLLSLSIRCDIVSGFLPSHPHKHPAAPSPRFALFYGSSLRKTTSPGG
ncbi:hypothetical protein Droror1_Dr00023720 [Drosera rotundifolia]